MNCGCKSHTTVSIHRKFWRERWTKVYSNLGLSTFWVPSNGFGLTSSRKTFYKNLVVRSRCVHMFILVYSSFRRFFCLSSLLSRLSFCALCNLNLFHYMVFEGFTGLSVFNLCTFDRWQALITFLLCLSLFRTLYIHTRLSSHLYSLTFSPWVHIMWASWK